MRPPFTWSWTRHRTFLRCERQYAYDYYVARRARRKDADARAVEIAACKALVSRPQWVGQVVHSLAERLLVAAQRRGDVGAVHATWLLEQNQALDLAIAGMSKLRFEADDEPWDALRNTLAAQGEAMVAHPLLRRLLAVPERIVEVEQFRQVRFGEVRATVSLDVLVRDGQGGMVVIDWKTGDATAEVHRGQLALYAAYVRDRYRVPLDRLTALLGSTRSGGFSRVDLSRDDLENLGATVRGSARAMVEKLPDPTKDQADEHHFERLPTGDARCETCNFRGVCFK